MACRPSGHFSPPSAVGPVGFSPLRRSRPQVTRQDRFFYVYAVYIGILDDFHFQPLLPFKLKEAQSQKPSFIKPAPRS